MMLKLWLQNRRLMKENKGDIELDQLGKIILGVVFLLILIFIVTIVIRGELGEQSDEVSNVFTLFR